MRAAQTIKEVASIICIFESLSLSSFLNVGLIKVDIILLIVWN